MTRLDPDWQMTWAFLLAITLLGLLMKGFAALRMRALGQPLRPFIFTPLAAPTSLARCQPVAAVSKVVLEAVLLLAALVLSYWLYGKLRLTLQPPAYVMSYLATGPLIYATELFASVVRLLWLPHGRLLPRGHERPWLARGPADFWGRRWNIWFSDWFRFALFQPMRRRPVLAVIVIFFVSGVMHELVVNLPLFLVTGRAPFGSMMIYFLLQAPALLVERRFLRQRPVLRVVLVWLIVFGPVPLMINEGLLRTLHLWPG